MNTIFHSTDATNNKNRTTLTKTIVWVGFAVLLILGLAVIVLAGDKKLDAAKSVFNSIVPLVAAWIGAVIAFYFGRDNYEVATQQALALTRDTLSDINVENIMINVKTIVAQKSNTDQDTIKKLKDIISLYEKVEKDRVPVFSTEIIPRYVIHLNQIRSYLSGKSDQASKDYTLADLIKEKQNSFGHNKEYGFVTVSKSTTLQKAIEEMEKTQNCRDIFVTLDGTSSGKVLGWLTDSLINRFLTVRHQQKTL
ncbi:CBS domain-containing protein [uncultured Croceitalea sp.]|uniref:CBS domain-containing protein n=1 Tax=uncultured Croceitalea sp. TaxID=1798908 RepID=UPI00374F6CE8